MAGNQIVEVDRFISDAVVIVPPITSRFDATADDSDKSFIVPGNELWKLNFAHVLYVSSGDAGNRIITIEILDENSNIIVDFVAGAVQAASATVHYTFLQGVLRETAVVNSEIVTALAADTYLKGGYTIRFFDSAVIAAAADDMTVSFQYQKFHV